MTQNTYTSLPHLTVATIVQKNGKFLVVKEESAGKKVYNQPAGHLENNETITDAAIRETYEETGWVVEPKQLLGVSQYSAPNGVTYVRISFIADPVRFDESATLDADILGTDWLSYDELVKAKDQLRSPMVLRDFEQFLSGSKYDLDILGGFVHSPDSDSNNKNK